MMTGGGLAAVRWRECMGIEPTQPDKGQVADGFEDRGSHQAPSTPPLVSSPTSREHEPIRLALDDNADLDRLGHQRKVLVD